MIFPVMAQPVWRKTGSLRRDPVPPSWAGTAVRVAQQREQHPAHRVEDWQWRGCLGAWVPRTCQHNPVMLIEQVNSFSPT